MCNVQMFMCSSTQWMCCQHFALSTRPQAYRQLIKAPSVALSEHISWDLKDKKNPVEGFAFYVEFKNSKAHFFQILFELKSSQMYFILNFLTLVCLLITRNQAVWLINSTTQTFPYFSQADYTINMIQVLRRTLCKSRCLVIIFLETEYNEHFSITAAYSLLSNLYRHRGL